jgi:hypothetical protein
MPTNQLLIEKSRRNNNNNVVVLRVSWYVVSSGNSTCKLESTLRIANRETLEFLESAGSPVILKINLLIKKIIIIKIYCAGKMSYGRKSSTYRSRAVEGQTRLTLLLF